LVLAFTVVVPADAAREQKEQNTAEETPLLSAARFAGLKLRGIGPALTSGRVSDIAVDPRDKNTWYLTAASGGVWKTINAGTTWEALFDGEGSYSIGCVAIDPNDSLTVWVGTGENNSQRSVGYGDGVYKSVDGGKSWQNVGLEESEHIAKIVVDPTDSETVYVAAQGPLWGPGGDRGLYKTTDGGESWQRVLEISQHTGVTDLLMDPRDPEILYAAAYQRRRHVWTVVNGGPESAIYKSTDGGASWRKLENGLPEGDIGRIGLAMSPVAPDLLYAVVEAAGDTGGFFRSTDAGANWEKRSDYVSASPQYYQELVPDPQNADRVYSLDVWLHVTENGGKSFEQVSVRHKHVDDHAMWIDPDDTDHLLVGCDGGLYESRDRAATWEFFSNLPITQFYKIAVDNDEPFYNVYGGTQDNFTLGGPSRTISAHGITNDDWFVTVGGDGFQTRVDPENPDIIYSQSQHGFLSRYDRRSGEAIRIRPMVAPGEEPLRFNWDSPLILSPHDSRRLYFGANKLFRSDDRGDSWRAISPDLTRQIDRNQLEVMGRVWSVDAVAKNRSTSFYGNLVALSESPLVEGLIYAGTDDGLVQVTEDGGGSWRRLESFPGVPERTYVNRLEASQHDADTVYAAFNNHKSADFDPYVLKSTDRGVSWTSIAGDLPERGSVYALAEDPVSPDLLFAGTEFGLFFTVDGGSRWVRLRGGLPTVAVRDLAIQSREGDLVVGTFGRGFFILDDYSPLRGVSEESLVSEALLFPVKDAWMYIPSYRLALRGKSFQGDSYYAAPNPPFGAVFTYYLKDGFKSRAERRREIEKEQRERGETVAYPDWDELRAEEREDKPEIVLTVRDADGKVVRRLTGSAGKGFHRVAWDLRYPAASPTRLEPFPMDNPFRDPPSGPLAAPGAYTVELASRVDGDVTVLAGPEGFVTRPLGLATLAAEDRQGLLAFQQKVGRLQRAVLGASRAVEEAEGRLDLLRRAIDETPGAPLELGDRALSLAHRLADLEVALNGDTVMSSRFEPAPPSIVGTVQRIVSAQWTSSSAPTGTNQAAYSAAAAAFEPVLEELRRLIEEELRALEAELEAAGGPWTPGRVPRWQPE
jgi:photosystem II stability/assembly factor-like uncharacterized protein